MNDETRALPHALPAEKAVLCLMLESPTEAFPVLAENRITADHFYIPAHQVLFESLHAMRRRELPIELVGVLQWLHDHGALDRCGGPGEVADLLGYVATPVHMRRHIEILREKWEARQIIATCSEAINETYDSPGEIPAVMASVEAKLAEIRDACSPVAKAATTRELVGRLLADLEAACNGEPTTRGIPTGFAELDSMTGGLKPGELTIIAARPSMGKTALMANIVDHVAIDAGKPVYVASLEMTAAQVVARLTYGRARLSQRWVEENPRQITKGQFAEIQNAMRDVARAILTIDDAAGTTIAELRAKVRRAHQTSPLALVAVDYLQLMRSQSRQAENSREREIGEISAGMKAMAKELAVPVLALAQLNRDSEKRGGKGSSRGIPRMSDLRESGNIEQDADIVGLLHRDDYFAEDEREKADAAGRARLIVAKNRNGPTGTVELTWVAETMRFQSGAPAREPSNHQPRQRWTE